VRPFRVLVLILVALAVPVQGALAVTAAQCMAMQHDQDDPHHSDSHEGHDKRTDCGPSACCASAAIVGAIRLLPCSPTHGLLVVAPVLPPLLPLLSGIDRPPRSL